MLTCIIIISIGFGVLKKKTARVSKCLAPVMHLLVECNWAAVNSAGTLPDAKSHQGPVQGA